MVSWLAVTRSVLAVRRRSRGSYFVLKKSVAVAW